MVSAKLVGINKEEEGDHEAEEGYEEEEEEEAELIVKQVEGRERRIF